MMFFRLTRLLFIVATAWAICLPDPPNLSRQELSDLKQSLEEYISSFSQRKHESYETSSMKNTKYGRNRYSGGMMTYPVESSDIGMQEEGSINYAPYTEQKIYYDNYGNAPYPEQEMYYDNYGNAPYPEQEMYYDNYGRNIYENGMNAEFLPVPPMPYPPNSYPKNRPVSAEENHMSNEHVSHEEQKTIDNIFYKSPRPSTNYRVTKTETYYPEGSVDTVKDTNAECNVNCYTHAPVLTNSLYGKGNSYGGAWQQMYVPGFLEKINGYDLVRNQEGDGNIFELQDLSNKHIAELQAMYGTDTWRILQEIYSPEYLVYLQRLYGPEFFNGLSLQSNINSVDLLRNNGQRRGGYWQLVFRPEYTFYGMDEHIDEYMQNPELFYQQMPFPWFNRPYRPHVPQPPVHKEVGPVRPPIDARFDAGNKTVDEVKEKETVHTEETKVVKKDNDITEEIDEDEDDDDENEEDSIDIGQRFDDDRKNKQKHKGKNKKHDEVEKTESKNETTIKDKTVVEVEHTELQNTTETKDEGAKDTGTGETVIHSLVEEKDNGVIDGSNGTTSENGGSNIAGEIQTRNAYGEGSIITNTIERHPHHLTLTINIPSETVSKKIEVTHPSGYEYSQTSYQEENNKNGHKSRSHGKGHAKKGEAGYEESEWEESSSGSDNKQSGGSGHGRRITKYKVVHHKSSKHGQHSGNSGVGKDSDEYDSSNVEESNGSSKYNGKSQGQSHGKKGGYKMGYRYSTGGSSEYKGGSGHAQNSKHGRRVVHKHVVHRHKGGNPSHGIHGNSSHHHGNSTGEDYDYEFETEYEDITGGEGSINKTTGGGGGSKKHWSKVGNRYSSGEKSSGGSGYKNGSGHKSGHRVVHKHVVHRHKGGNSSHGLHGNSSHHHGNSTGEDYDYEFETEYEDISGGEGSINKTTGGGGGSKKHWSKVGNRYSSGGESSGGSGYKNGSGHKSGHRVVHKHVVHRHKGGNSSHGLHGNSSHHHGNSTGEDYDYEFETEYEDISGGEGSLNKTTGGGGGSKKHWSKVGNRYSSGGESSGGSGYKNGSGHRVVHKHVVHRHKGGNSSHGLHGNSSHHHGNSTGEDYDYEFETEYEDISGGEGSLNKTTGGGGGSKKHWSKVGNRYSSGGESSGGSGYKNGSGHRVVHKHVVHRHKGGNSSHGLHGNSSHHHGNSTGEDYDYEFETEYEDISGGEGSLNKTTGGGGGSKKHWSKVGNRYSSGGESSGGSGYKNGSGHKSGHRVVHKHVIHGHKGGNSSHGFHGNSSHHHGNSTDEDYDYEFESEYEDITGDDGSINKTVGGGGGSKKHWSKVGNRYSTGGHTSGSSGHKNGSGHRVVHKHIIHGHKGGNSSQGFNMSSNGSHKHGNSSDGEDYEYETEYEEFFGDDNSGNSTTEDIPGNNSKTGISNNNGVKYVVKEEVIPSMHTISVDIPAELWTSGSGKQIITGGPTVEIKTETGTPQTSKIIEVSKDPFISHPPDVVVEDKQPNGLFSSILEKTKDLIGNSVNNVENAIIGGP